MKKSKNTPTTFINVPGNFEDKYAAKNPISRKLVTGFLSVLKQHLSTVIYPKKILEAGAGEGKLTKILAELYPTAEVIASDLEESVNNKARVLLAKYKNAKVQQEDVEKLSFADGTFDLVLCCEVLEHVPHPEKALSELRRVLRPGGVLIASVPREPIWRALNMARLKYLPKFGNTPGHVNHWKRSAFKRFIRKGHMTIVSDDSPFPWTMVRAVKTS